MMFKEGDIVKHFKRGTRGSNDFTYCYRVLHPEAYHTETGDRCVVYEALYGDRKVYCRPYDMFHSKVDKEKYPDIEQEYRFERVEDVDLLENLKKL